MLIMRNREIHLSAIVFGINTEKKNNFHLL
jgi:hypothetical protein